MLKKICIVIISVTTLLLTGCNFDGEEYKTPSQQAEELQSDIIECFINKDKETLKSYYSKYVIENYTNIDTQIDEAFDFIDGEIVSYDEPFPSECGGMEKKSYGAQTQNIITDKGTEYKISFEGWLTNEEEPEKVGVSYIRVIDMTGSYDSSKTDKENGILWIGGEDFI